jgi:hypothetical protein
MTAQVSERLIYGGKEIPIFSNPLSTYIRQTGIKFESPTTANWRGYVGTWEIKGTPELGKRLYLVGIKAHKTYEEILELKDLFPNSPNGVFAHWYSGTLRCPQGNRVKYVHMGYASKYEFELFMEFNKGVLINQYAKHNQPEENEVYDSKDIPSFLRKQCD